MYSQNILFWGALRELLDISNHRTVPSVQDKARKRLYTWMRLLLRSEQLGYSYIDFQGSDQIIHSKIDVVVGARKTEPLVYADEYKNFTIYANNLRYAYTNHLFIKTGIPLSPHTLNRS